MPYNDDRRYMTFEQRAADDPSYRKPTTESNKMKTCKCGKTVLVDSFGTKTGNRCPRFCETNGYFCMCCGRGADLQNSDQGYSHCCNDRITNDPTEHPDYEWEVDDTDTYCPNCHTCWRSHTGGYCHNCGQVRR